MNVKDMTIKARVFNAGHTMKDLVTAINDLGISCTASQMSDAMTGRLSAPKTAQLIQASITVLEEWERGRK